MQPAIAVLGLGLLALGIVGLLLAGYVYAEATGGYEVAVAEARERRHDARRRNGGER